MLPLLRRASLLTALVVIVLAVACGGDDASAPAAATITPPPLDSGIKGLATVGPTCPVERADSPCPDQPFEGTIIVQNAAGKEVARTMTDADGRFSFALPIGQYVVTAQGNGPLPAPAVAAVTVQPGLVVSIKLQLDSGIR